MVHAGRAQRKIGLTALPVKEGTRGQVLFHLFKSLSLLVA